MSGLVLAIDGPSGSGKSSTAKAIALRANWSYLDTGALYRAATYIALANKVEDEEEIIRILEESDISFDTNPAAPKICVDGNDISEQIRFERINDRVSQISAMVGVRKILIDLQRKYITDAPIGIVVEGRDIGTVVAPNAQLKIYLHADITERAKRRENEMVENIGEDIVSKSLANRDEIDSNRKISPLTQAEMLQ
jgi:GTPase